LLNAWVPALGQNKCVSIKGLAPGGYENYPTSRRDGVFLWVEVTHSDLSQCVHLIFFSLNSPCPRRYSPVSTRSCLPSKDFSHSLSAIHITSFLLLDLLVFYATWKAM